jgi:hypothetical protein
MRIPKEKDIQARVLEVARENTHLHREVNRLRAALVEVERHCPCGARPESLNTHPHVTGCPVGNALYPRQFDGFDAGGSMEP